MYWGCGGNPGGDVGTEGAGGLAEEGGADGLALEEEVADGLALAGVDANEGDLEEVGVDGEELLGEEKHSD